MNRPWTPGFATSITLEVKHGGSGQKRKQEEVHRSHTKVIYLTSATSDLCLSNDRRFGCTGLAEALKKRMERRLWEGHGFLALTTVCSSCGLIFLPCPCCCGRSSRIVSGRVRGNGSVKKNAPSRTPTIACLSRTQSRFRKPICMAPLSAARAKKARSGRTDREGTVRSSTHPQRESTHSRASCFGA